MDRITPHQKMPKWESYCLLMQAQVTLWVSRLILNYTKTQNPYTRETFIHCTLPALTGCILECAGASSAPLARLHSAQDKALCGGGQA